MAGEAAHQKRRSSNVVFIRELMLEQIYCRIILEVVSSWWLTVVVVGDGDGVVVGRGSIRRNT